MRLEASTHPWTEPLFFQTVTEPINAWSLGTLRSIGARWDSWINLQASFLHSIKLFPLKVLPCILSDAICDSYVIVIISTIPLLSLLFWLLFRVVTESNCFHRPTGVLSAQATCLLSLPYNHDQLGSRDCSVPKLGHHRSRIKFNGFW